MITLDEARKVFSDALAENPTSKWRMDTAFATAMEWAYKKGFEDGQLSLNQDIIDASTQLF